MEQEHEQEALVYSGAVIEFVAVANEVCGFLENAGEFPRKGFVERLNKVLPLLYYKAVLLPGTESMLEYGTEKFVTEDDWHTINNSIRATLGRFDDYPEVIDPVVKDTEDRVGGSIAENMADIYQDLKNFIMVYRMGTVELMNEALWECMEHFDESWGQKLLNSLRALHAALHGNENLDETDGKRQDQDKKNDRDTSEWIVTRRQKLWKKNEEEDEE